jgi:HSP20 family protein
MFKAMAEMEDEMTKWLQATESWPQHIAGIDFSPTCNVKETPKEFVIQFDIPGVKKEDVKIELENNRLTVRGERKEKSEEKDAKHFLCESCYGSFMRTLNLPTAVAENKVDAHYDNGVLTINVPKIEPTKTKAIEVH